MSAISSFSAANVYSAVDRNSLAQSTEAVAGTKQAFAETDQEAPHEGRDEGQDAKSGFPTTNSPDAKTPVLTNNHRYVLNVTA